MTHSSQRQENDKTMASKLKESIKFVCTDKSAYKTRKMTISFFITLGAPQGSKPKHTLKCLAKQFNRNVTCYNLADFKL